MELKECKVDLQTLQSLRVTLCKGSRRSAPQILMSSHFLTVVSLRSQLSSASPCGGASPRRHSNRSSKFPVRVALWGKGEAGIVAANVSPNEIARGQTWTGGRVSRGPSPAAEQRRGLPSEQLGSIVENAPPIEVVELNDESYLC